MASSKLTSTISRRARVVARISCFFAFYFSLTATAFLPKTTISKNRFSLASARLGATGLDAASGDFLPVVQQGLESVAATVGFSEEQVLIGAVLAGASVLAVTQPPSRLISSSALSTLVQGTFLQRADESGNLVRLYKASTDGWSALDFHNAVDNVGSAVVVAKTVLGQTVGGYNPVGWRSTDDYTATNSAFLWSLKGNQFIKFPVLGGGDNAAIFDFATAGPCFGSSDFIIGPQKTAVMGGFAGPDSEDLSMGAGSLKEGLSNSAIGGTYQTDRRWPIRGRFRVVDVEVYGNGSNRR